MRDVPCACEYPGKKAWPPFPAPRLATIARRLATIAKRLATIAVPDPDRGTGTEDGHGHGHEKHQTPSPTAYLGEDRSPHPGETRGTAGSPVRTRGTSSRGFRRSSMHSRSPPYRDGRTRHPRGARTPPRRSAQGRSPRQYRRAPCAASAPDRPRGSGCAHRCLLDSRHRRSNSRDLRRGSPSLAADLSTASGR
jgi:hypothetical protein